MQRQLEEALEAGDSEEVLRLCAQLDTNIQLMAGFETQSVAHHVARWPVSLQCLRLLVDRLGPDCLMSRNRWDQTPVHLAAKYKDASWLQLMLDILGKNCFLVRDGVGRTVTHHAAWNSNSNSSLKFLVRQLDSLCLKVPNSFGNTAVHFAARWQSADSLQFLSDQLGSRMFSLKNKRGQTLSDWVEEDPDVSRRSSKQEWIASQQRNLRPPSPPYLKNWDCIRLIGRGGFGEVHEVLTDKGIRCAAKTIKLPVQPGDQQDPSWQEMIEKAVESERNLCLLSHNNIVRFLYLIAQPESATVVLFMELLNGRSLERFLDSKPLDEATIREFCEQISSALHYMHSRRQSVVHGDINCSNIMVLADSRRIKLVDFGLSIKLEQSVSHITESATTPKGTLNFMAPELLVLEASDSPQYSRESDVWAFGCSVFQMASGARPYARVMNLFQMAKQLEENGAPEFPAGYSAALRQFYGCCTARDRRMRMPAKELMKHEFLLSPNSSS